MRKLLLILLLYCLSFYHASAQERWTAKDVIKLEDADIYLEITDYNTALKMYSPLYEKYGPSENMEYKIGLCHFYLGDKEEAKEFFERSTETGYANAHYYLGLYYHENELFDEAMQQFQIYKNTDGRKDFEGNEIDRRIEFAERAKNMIANPIQATIYNLGDQINTEYDDYGPLITADETLMAFTSRRAGTTGDKKDPYGDYLEDIYFATNENDSWTDVKNAGVVLNSKTHDAAVGLSPNGNSMIVYRTNKELSAGDLYLTHQSNGTWSEPELLDEAINSEYQEASACLTDDERVIYFSSNRPGGQGGKDLYRVVRIGENIWSLPLNLGPTINTPYDEDAPFIHPNGSTLYFSSKGHNTMGGYDIFSTSLKDDYWSTPKNIGYPANTVRDDIFFVLAADGKRGYYSTYKRDGFGGHDIYAVSFENSIESLRILKGCIKNEQGIAIQADIFLKDENDEDYGVYRPNSSTGNYIIILPPDLNFNLTIEAEGFEIVKDSVYYKGGTNTKEKDRNYTLKMSVNQ